MVLARAHRAHAGRTRSLCAEYKIEVLWCFCRRCSVRGLAYIRKPPFYPFELQHRYAQFTRGTNRPDCLAVYVLSTLGYLPLISDFPKASTDGMVNLRHQSMSYG